MPIEVMCSPDDGGDAAMAKEPREPKRFGEAPLGQRTVPTDGYRYGLHVDAFKLRLADALTQWTFLEDDLVYVFRILLNISDHSSARQIFRGISAQSARIALMRQMLTGARSNAARDAFFDEVIAEFERLNTIRNTFVHGAWHTHETGTVVIEDFLKRELSRAFSREVTLEEINTFLRELWSLGHRIKKRSLDDFRTASPFPPASP